MTTATDKPSQAPVAVRSPGRDDSPRQNPGTTGVIAADGSTPSPGAIVLLRDEIEKLCGIPAEMLGPPAPSSGYAVLYAEREKYRRSRRPWPSEYPINDPRNTCGAY